MIKVSSIFIFTLVCWINYATAQAPNWIWASTSGENDSDIGSSVSTDSNGNIVIIGSFASPTISFGTTILTNANNTGTTTDIFIVKYSAGGNVLWAKSVGGTFNDYGNCISTDANGNVFVTGYFTSINITFGTTILNNTGNWSVFIAKYDASGNEQWAKSANGTKYNNSKSVATDTNGNIIIAGSFSSPRIIFENDTLTNTDNTGNSDDLFIVKYGTGGNVIWAKNAGGNGNDEDNIISIDTNGNVFITGWFYSPTIDFGITTINNAGADDIFIAKYDVNGNVIWAQSAGGSDFDFGNGITTDASGNVIMTGSFSSDTIFFGTTILINTIIPGTTCDIFIVKYNSGGNVIWAHSVGGPDYDFGNSVSNDTSGNVILTGSFTSDTITFGTNDLINSKIPGTSYDIYVVKYDAGGNLIWAKSVGGTSDDFANSITTDPSNNVYIIGSYNSNNIIFGTTTLTNAGSNTADIFIAKLDTAITTGIAEQIDQPGLTIAPNPFTCQTILTFNKEQKNTTINIVDILGNEIKDITFSGKQCVIEKGAMKPGIYFVRLIDENKNVASGKIIVQ